MAELTPTARESLRARDDGISADSGVFIANFLSTLEAVTVDGYDPGTAAATLMAFGAQLAATVIIDGDQQPLSAGADLAMDAAWILCSVVDPDPAAEYGGDLTAPLCCCKRGSMCASCGTGRHFQCPDRDDPDDDYEEDEDQ